MDWYCSIRLPWALSLSFHETLRGLRGHGWKTEHYQPELIKIHCSETNAAHLRMSHRQRSMLAAPLTHVCHVALFNTPFALEH